MRKIHFGYLESTSLEKLPGTRVLGWAQAWTSGIGLGDSTSSWAKQTLAACGGWYPGYVAKQWDASDMPKSARGIRRSKPMAPGR